MIAQQTFDRFADDLREILGSNLFEIVIHGSYALDDFRANRGDLDYMVITNENLDEPTIGSLFKLHDEYRSRRTLLLHQLEGTFYPKHVLENPASPFIGCYIGTGRNGWRTIDSFQNILIDLRMIEDKGIYLLNNKARIYHPSENEILSEQKEDLENLTRALRGDGASAFWHQLRTGARERYSTGKMVRYLRRAKPADGVSRTVAGTISGNYSR